MEHQIEDADLTLSIVYYITMPILTNDIASKVIMIGRRPIALGRGKTCTPIDRALILA
jgi:hypothetical protein